ncbi:uncharacterized protein CC84DRAFT_1168949 [Paraphaeosphaeria sporulosa]|uniref:Uncharacterized protein n=1 Tax=Paraphaeosphaeria sporulosa TaxID=1460663 RepID=A0A177C038_9PLEO|nr:uncharacterized protein CC84DRAFT_1168949 [Paraphaeosphaeria sporulosa]OAG00067.1 hypothetical protein CC84DRAFT_1168949 [Paraphaeosphaeria sporulosa]
MHIKGTPAISPRENARATSRQCSIVPQTPPPLQPPRSAQPLSTTHATHLEHPLPSHTSAQPPTHPQSRYWVPKAGAPGTPVVAISVSLIDAAIGRIADMHRQGSLMREGDDWMDRAGQAGRCGAFAMAGGGQGGWDGGQNGTDIDRYCVPCVPIHVVDRSGERDEHARARRSFATPRVRDTVTGAPERGRGCHFWNSWAGDALCWSMGSQRLRCLAAGWDAGHVCRIGGVKVLDAD